MSLTHWSVEIVMEDELEKMWAAFRLTDKEKRKVVLSPFNYSS